MWNLMVINLLVDYFLKQVLAGIVNILRSQAQIQAAVFKFSLMEFFGMPISGSMDFISAIIKSGYIGAAYDITDYIKFDQDNVLWYG